MTQANATVTVADDGAGNAIATHLINGKEHQAVVIVDEDGHILDSLPKYRLVVPSQAVGANKVHCDIFNASGSGKIMRVLSAFCYLDNDTAVTGTLGAEVMLTRTSAVGTGGTANTTDDPSTTATTITKLDTANAAVPAQITARAAPAGGATAGAVIARRWIFTEETNAGAALAGILGAEFVRNVGVPVKVREGEGLRFVQGAIASVGSLSFEITFELL